MDCLDPESPVYACFDRATEIHCADVGNELVQA
jgi:hypothetical protein